MIDFDGVIHKYTEWNNGKLNNDIIPGAQESITLLKQDFEIVIFTSRAINQENSKQYINDVSTRLKDHDVPFDSITAEKLPALAYIDDRGIRFENNWGAVLSKLKTII